MIKISKKRTHEEFVEVIRDKYGDRFTILGQYTLCRDKIEYRCNICNTQSHAAANHLIIRGSCRTCSNERLRQERSKTHDEFTKQAYDVNPAIEIIGEYINQKTKIEVVCRVCEREHIW